MPEESQTPTPQPIEPTTPPVAPQNIETLSSATPNSQTVTIPGGPIATDTSKTMRNMLIAVFFTVIIIIGFLIYIKYTGKSLPGQAVPSTDVNIPTETVVTDAPLNESEAVQGIEIEAPDFTEIETDINQL